LEKRGLFIILLPREDQKKRPGLFSRALCGSRLQLDYFSRLLAFRSLLNFEFDLLALL